MVIKLSIQTIFWLVTAGLKNMVKLQGCMVNALVPEVDERRDKLR